MYSIFISILREKNETTPAFEVKVFWHTICQFKTSEDGRPMSEYLDLIDAFSICNLQHVNENKILAELQLNEHGPQKSANRAEEQFRSVEKEFSIQYMFSNLLYELFENLIKNQQYQMLRKV